MRRAIGAAVLCVVALSSSARAEDRAACREAFDKGQSLRAEGKLSAARRELLQCTSVCPPAFQKPCETWLTELDASQPSIVLRAVDGAGQDIVNVRVSLDGATIADALDGKSVAVDPGPHVIRFEMPGHAPIERSIVVATGEKNRIVLAAFESPKSEPARPPAEPPRDSSEPRAGAPAAAWIAGGVGVVAIGGFAYFGLAGNAKHDDLVNGCSKTASCSQSDKDAVLRDWHVADALLAAGVVAIGVSAYLFLHHDRASVGVHPNTNGASAVLRVAF